MIKLESIHIEEMRGIRKLDIDVGKQTFAISGPNGSGKSGVIDAIEFGLTGQIGRLRGQGTKDLSVTEHGPHVDNAKSPDRAFVRLKVFLTDTGKQVTITRRVASAKKPEIEPADNDVKAVLDEIAHHPEIALSRREILRFILVEPTKRSEEIQAILKLDDIGSTRSAFNTAQNKLRTAHKIASTQAQSARDALQRHLSIKTLDESDVLSAVNRQRQVLALTPIDELKTDTELDAGLASTAKSAEINRDSAIQDLSALADAASEFADLERRHAAATKAALTTLENDPTLLEALRRRSFIEEGLNFLDGPECPLCDTNWKDESLLREHLQAKLAKSEKATALQRSLLKSGAEIMENAVRTAGLIARVNKVAVAEKDADFAEMLATWGSDLEQIETRLGSVAGVVGLKDRIERGWLNVPEAFAEHLKVLTATLAAKPDQTATLAAQTFLSGAQGRLVDCRNATRVEKASESAWKAAKAAYDAYCDILERELNALYEQVQKDFCEFYRAINGEDESAFAAKFTPSEGSLRLDVSFYERGLFPPGAYHSEGHQDSMGVCLYLALMKRLFGPRFTFALLDDVVMSVDSGHRHEFCNLLKTFFGDTQFIVTTHDRLWAEQMKQAKLVTSKTSLVFHSWTIDSGPLVESNKDIWEEIEAALAKDKVETAAHALRRHLEYVSRVLADQLGATPQFRSDGNYELGELLPSVLKRYEKLCGKAADAAQSWGDTAGKSAVAERKSAFSASKTKKNVEEWAINKAVHYNEWADFVKKDFEPVVAGFKELLACFRCKSCGSWIYVTPQRGNLEALRCHCSAVNLNLKAK